MNTECCIQIQTGSNPDKCKPHWYCDAVAIDFSADPLTTVFLCEISYAEKLGRLVGRLKEWAANWTELRSALIRDCKVPGDWPVRPWLFVPARSVKMLTDKLALLKSSDGSPAFRPRITTLESVQPWLYHSWDHQDKNTPKPDVPEDMRI